MNIKNIYKENGEEEVGLNHRHRCSPNDAIQFKKKKKIDINFFIRKLYYGISLPNFYKFVYASLVGYIRVSEVSH